MTTLRTQEQGYPCQIWMSIMYNIFQNEKNKVLDLLAKGVSSKDSNNVSKNASILYSEERKSVQYKNSDGVMTAIFKKDGSEDFYFRSADETKKVGLGTKFLSLSNNGKKCDFVLENESAIPELFRYIADRYSTNRDEIGIDKLYERSKGKQRETGRKTGRDI